MVIKWDFQIRLPKGGLPNGNMKLNYRMKDYEMIIVLDIQKNLCVSHIFESISKTSE